jgi:hypothetical protein
MSSFNFIPHHLFVAAASQPARTKRKPNRDLLERVRLEDEAMAVSLEFLEDGRPDPLSTRPLQVCTQAS